MGRLIEEVREWNTPLVGSYLLWRFTDSYRCSHASGEAPVVLLHFIAYTMLTTTDYSNPISGRRDNLASYVRVFSEKKCSDMLACLSQNIKRHRESALTAIDIAVATGLLAWDVENARLFPLQNLTPKRGTGMRGIDVQKTGGKADTLGKWFAVLDVATVTSSLGIIS
jgi:hypothetical protein